MSLEKTLSIPYNIIKKHPKIVLPAAISWIPGLLMLIIISGILENTNIVSWIKQPDNFILPSQEIIKYGVYFLLVAIFFVLIDVLLRTYFQIVVFERNKNISKLLEKSTKYFWKMLWTLILKNIILLIVIVSAFAFLSLGLFFHASIVLSIPLFILTVVLAVLLHITLYPLPAIIVKENKSGIKAIKRSIEFSRKNFWSLVLLLIILWVFNTIVSFTLSPLLSTNLLYITLPIYSLIWLFIGAYLQMIPAAFYVSCKKR